jgi:hypothetical protein
MALVGMPGVKPEPVAATRAGWRQLSTSNVPAGGDSAHSRLRVGREGAVDAEAADALAEMARPAGLGTPCVKPEGLAAATAGAAGAAAAAVTARGAAAAAAAPAASAASASAAAAAAAERGPALSAQPQAAGCVLEGIRIQERR